MYYKNNNNKLIYNHFNWLLKLPRATIFALLFLDISTTLRKSIFFNDCHALTFVTVQCACNYVVIDRRKLLKGSYFEVKYKYTMRQHHS